MKRATFVVLICIAFGQIQARPTSNDISSEDPEDKLDSTEELCMDELHFDKETFVRVNQDKVAPEDISKRDQVTVCYGIKKGFAKQNGEVDYDGLVNRLLEDIVLHDPEGTPTSRRVYTNILQEAAEECRKDGASHGDNLHEKITNAIECVSKKQTEKVDEFISS